MDKIIVDTNIVFSALLNTNGTIADLLLNSNETFEFYSASYLKEEIEKHWEKLLEISGFSSSQLSTIKDLVYSKINFFSEDIIPFEFWKKAADIVRDVDMDDIAFVTLCLFIDGTILWTGDEKLLNGIKAKGFDKVIRTSELIELRNKLEQG